MSMVGWLFVWFWRVGLICSFVVRFISVIVFCFGFGFKVIWNCLIFVIVIIGLFEFLLFCVFVGGLKIIFNSMFLEIFFKF